MTLKQTLEAIKTQAEAIAQVQQVELIEREQISNEQASNYPLVLINSDYFSFSINDQTASEDIYINVVCLDRLLQDKSNLVDAYNWTHEILKEITTKLTRLEGYDIQVQQNSVKLVDVAIDAAAGWVQQFVIKTYFTRDSC
jgi:hypothetical protein